MKKMIITADDYGMSVAVNRAIDECIEASLVTSTNVMMNMPFCNDAIKLTAYNDVSVGIHFTLTCGEPVSDVERIATIVSSEGKFYPFGEFRKRYRKNLINDDDIVTELQAQYEKYLETMGCQPAYWNTHQNVHVDFRIYKLFVDFACKNNICNMRSHQRIYVEGSTKDNKRSLLWRIEEPVKSYMLDNWQNSAHKKGINSPDGIIVCLNKKDTDKPDYLFENIKWHNNNLAEYVIHPAIENDSPYFGKIVEQRICEYRMFTSQTTKKIIENAGIELVPFENKR